MIDKIFKIGLLVLGFGYLAYLFCPISNQAGKYHDCRAVIDTGIQEDANKTEKSDYQKYLDHLRIKQIKK